MILKDKNGARDVTQLVKMLVEHAVNPKYCINQVWWLMPRIPALGRWKQEDQENTGILKYIANSRPAWAN